MESELERLRLLAEIKDHKLQAMERELQAKNLQLKAIERELQIQDLRLQAKYRESGNGSIWDYGLPPLGYALLENIPLLAPQKLLDPIYVGDNLDVPILSDLRYNNKISVAWLAYNKRDWNNEAMIRNVVEMVIVDILAGCGLNLSVFPEVAFVGIDPKRPDRMDIAIEKRGNLNATVGAIEVRKPPYKKQIGKNEFDFNDCKQIGQYIYDLRACHGVRMCVGVLTTYEKWRFVWLEDSHEAMLTTTCKAYKDLTSASPISPDNSAVIPPSLACYRSKVYYREDPDLVKILATICYKWNYTQCDGLKGFFHANRMYQKFPLMVQSTALKRCPANYHNSVTRFHRMQQRNCSIF